MTEFLFPDNTVLCNFAAVARLDLLKAALDGRGRWTDAVADEAIRSARYIPALSQVGAEGWLGEPVDVDDVADVSEIERTRRAVFGGTEDNPRKHLGEAQTCHVILKWREFAGSWWISDDRESLRYARRQGITTRETIDLVEVAVGSGIIGAGDAFALMQQMIGLGRHLRLPRSAEQLSQRSEASS